MANLTSTLTVRLLDQVSGPARAAAASLLGIGAAAAGANARGLAAGGFAASMATMARHAETAATRMRAAAHSINWTFALPTGLIAGFAGRQVYQFERVSNAVQAVTNITDEQRVSLQRYAQSLNALFPLDNRGIMQAAFELGRAGLNFDQIMGSLRGTLSLALAGDIDPKEASDIATNVLTAMRLPMRTTEQTAASLTRVIDALAFAATNSNTDVRLMGDTFKYVGPMAAAAGMSINDVTAAAMIMAQSGIRGSEAGVAMRSGLVRMVRPTRDMQAALSRLNIDMRDYVRGGRQITAQSVINSLAANAIDAKPFSAQIEEVLRDPALQRNLSQMVTKLADIIGPGSVMDRTELASVLTDTLTAAGSNIDFIGFFRALREKGVDVAEIARLFDVRQGARLITLQAGDLVEMLGRIEREASGAAERMSRIRMRGIVGTWDAFTASIENLVLAIARSGVLDAATSAIKGLTSAIERLAAASPTALRWGTYLAMIGAAAGPALLVLAGLARLVKVLAAAGAWMAGGTAATAAAGAGTGLGAAAAGAGGVAAISRLGMLARMGGVVGLSGAVLHGLGTFDRISDGINRQIERGLTGAPWLRTAAPWLFTAAPGTLAGAPDALNTMGERFAIEQRHEERMAAIRRDLEARPMLSGAADPAMLPRPNAGAAASAATETFSAFHERAREQLAQTREMIARETAAMMQMLNFSAGPTITPRVDGSALRGVHGDVGVDVAR